ncbi:DNA polymerase III subunit epsilon [Buchnera aphidicola]|uniref:DNA polymerase III subunit epsilon n=1 Tax=Buchnera aphidicola TaxID=9 RepID=UPI0030EB4C1A
MNEPFTNRKIVLDTETTGMNTSGKIYLNHKIIEIGAVEIKNRKITNNNFHQYINPNRKIDESAFKIHGISNSFLKNKPLFSHIYLNFLNYIKNSEIIIHNASFDVNFLNYEFSFLNTKIKDITKICKVTDTLKMARVLFPGKRNSLDALCKRYKVISNRNFHGALLDANILAKIYLLMTSGQKSINFKILEEKNKKNISFSNYKNNRKPFFLKSSLKDLKNHKKYLNFIKK